MNANTLIPAPATGPVTAETAHGATGATRAPIDLESLPRADAIPVGPDATPAFRRVRRVVQLLTHSVVRVRVHGRENIPAGPYVLIANHLNWIDSFVISATFPAEPRLHFLGEVKHIVPHARQWQLMQAMRGFIPMAGGRRDPALFVQVRRCLDAGGVVALYPEATYGEQEGEILPFKKGFAHFAIDAGVPVLPVGLTGTKHLWLGKRITMTVGAPLPSAGCDVATLVTRGEAAVRALLPGYREPRGPKLLRRRLTTLFFSGHHS